MTLKDHPLTFPIVDICELEDNPTSREGNTSTTEPSDERLGKEIVARVDAGDKCEDRAIDKFRSAGHMLIRAKQRVSNFSAFLRDHCNNLSRSCADELIKIAEGRFDEVRAKSNARKHRFRLRKAAAAAEAGVRSGTDTDSTGCQLSSAAALVAFKLAGNTLISRMDQAEAEAALAHTRECVETRLQSIA